MGSILDVECKHGTGIGSSTFRAAYFTYLVEQNNAYFINQMDIIIFYSLSWNGKELRSIIQDSASQANFCKPVECKLIKQFL